MKTTKTILHVVLLGLVLASSVLAQAPAEASNTKYRAVFELSAAQGDEWDYLIAHVTNMKAALDKEGGVQAEVVFFGPGLAMLTKRGGAPYEQQLKRLADAGVKLSACQNAMRFMRLTSEDLFPFATEVDSGVAELVRKQQAGWAYIK